MRVLLLLPTSTYRAPDFVRAATRLGIEVVVGSDEMPMVMEGAIGKAASGRWWCPWTSPRPPPS